MLEALVAVTIVEVVLLLGVLAAYLVAILRGLRRSMEVFERIAFGVRAIEVQVGRIGPSASRLNASLEELTRVVKR